MKRWEPGGRPRLQVLVKDGLWSLGRVESMGARWRAVVHPPYAGTAEHRTLREAKAWVEERTKDA